MSLTPSKRFMAWATAIATPKHGDGMADAGDEVTARIAALSRKLQALWRGAPDPESDPDRAQPPRLSEGAAGGEVVLASANAANARRWLSPITRRIVLINLIGLVVMVGGTLALNNFRAGLVDARVAALSTEGELIAGALAESALIEPDVFFDMPTFDLEAAVPIMRRLARASGTRLRLFGDDGRLLLDSRALLAASEVQTYQLPPPGGLFSSWPFVTRIYDWIVGRLPSIDLPRYDDGYDRDGTSYGEVRIALMGDAGASVRRNDQGFVVVSVAVPIQRLKVVQGVLLLSSERGEIEQMLRAERLQILQIFLIALGVSILLSLLLSRTIGGPVRVLAAAADAVRGRREGRVQIPDLGARRDEIGDLARALSDMTGSLYDRLDAIERFAADVAHEIKNPLTSLRSAVETLERTSDPERRARLLAIILEDVGRLDRLITDISQASRLDAELTRERMVPVDLAALLKTTAAVASMPDRHHTAPVPVEVVLDTGALDTGAFHVMGMEGRLGQVFRNIIDNAQSFSPPQGRVRVTGRMAADHVDVTIEDEGPGIAEGKCEEIFERFYTEREGHSQFGKHSGLGLAIARQILEAHRGTIRAENRVDADGTIKGARFVVMLPR